MRRRIKRNIIISLVVIVSLAIIGLKPYFSHRDAVKIVDKVFQNWQQGDSLAALSFFEDARKSPPIFEIRSYKVDKKIFDRKNGKGHAVFHVYLEFPGEDLFPSGEWIMELTDSLVGWKVTDIYQTRDTRRPSY